MNSSSTHTPKSFKASIQEKLEGKRAQEKAELERSLLGTIRSSHLIHQDYNLDMNYIMRQRVQEYQKDRQTQYFQFVKGMVPDEIVEDLKKLEAKQKDFQEKEKLHEENEASALEAQVRRRLKNQQQSLVSSIKQQKVVDEAPEEPSSDEEPAQQLSKHERKVQKLHNPAVNCQMYLKQKFPEVFKQAHRRFFDLK